MNKVYHIDQNFKGCGSYHAIVAAESAEDALKISEDSLRPENYCDSKHTLYEDIALDGVSATGKPRILALFRYEE